MKEFVSKLTWADYIALVALLRGLYMGYKSGFFHELLRLASYIVTIVVTILLFERVAQLLTLRTFLNLATARMVAMGAVAAAVYLAAKIFRTVLVKLLKVGEGGILNRLLGMTVGAVRLLTLLSFLFMLVDMSPLRQLQEDVHGRSLTGDKISRVAPALVEFLSQVSPQMSVSKKEV